MSDQLNTEQEIQQPSSISELATELQEYEDSPDEAILEAWKSTDRKSTRLNPVT